MAISTIPRPPPRPQPLATFPARRPQGVLATRALYHKRTRGVSTSPMYSIFPFKFECGMIETKQKRKGINTLKSVNILLPIEGADSDAYEI
ncbi:hypothetical protein PsorP6_001526 [Peronosclerospora sorghi]|uniref:Uncharacterized protein n=1 Tax=Peronosclerospora sorghi TaxID=230839 RepID=A0ACC0WTP8_9STRA|nr:hypothetical protein PsorP6_001526 [Peronosclerospora sorghi]